MGRPATPTGKLLTRGGFRKDRHGGRMDVGMQTCRLFPPPWLSETAKEQWDAIADTVAGMQVSTTADQGALEMLVEAKAQYIKAARAVEKEGEVVKGSTGSPVQNPWVRIRDSAWKRYMTAAREFGMTPCSRADASAAQVPEKSVGKDRFFKPKIAS